MKPTNNCKICGSDEVHLFLKTQDYFLTNEAFDLIKCDQCGYIATYPVPANEDLGKYYDSKNYLSHTAAQKGMLNRMYQILRSLNIKRKYNHIVKYKQNGNILDIGCGTGELLNYFSTHKWKATGIEPNAEARTFGTYSYQLDIKDESELKNLTLEQYDVISMWHVLEHVPDINHRIEQIKKLLKPDGIIVIALPNINSYDAIKYGRFWAGLDVPRHLHHFSPNSFNELAKKHQLQLLESIPMKMDSFYVSLLSEKYKNNSLALFSGFFSGLVSNFKGRRSNNYSSMIFVLKKE
jgi:SAM-dependent methyltransferase